jgi:hypothetical protein
MRIILSFVIILTLLGCNLNNDEKIVLTCGLGMDPDGLRFGIEINQDKVFYCEEIPNKEGKYNYYQSDFNSEEFLKLKQKLQLSFKQKVVLHDIVDATPYQLDIDFKDDKRVIKFYYAFLNERQIAVLNAITDLKRLKFKPIKFHEFPKVLLNEKLPPPPSELKRLEIK